MHVDWSLLVSLGALAVSAFAYWTARTESRKSDKRQFLVESCGLVRILSGNLKNVTTPELRKQLDTDKEYARRPTDALQDVLAELNRIRPKAERWHKETFYPLFVGTYDARERLDHVIKSIDWSSPEILSAVDDLQDALARYHSTATQALRKL